MLCKTCKTTSSTPLSLLYTKGQENWQQGFANVPVQLGMTIHHCKENVRKKKYIERDVADYIGNAVSRGSTQKAKHQQALTGAH